MTSNNMLAGRRHPKRMGAALAFFNFSWSAGSVACPLLAAQFLRHAAGGTAFGLVGLLALPFVLLSLLADRRRSERRRRIRIDPSGIKEAIIILYFALLAFLYVGIEASVGSWMSTYTTRTTAWTFAGGTLAVAVFWAALLLGRGLTPALLARVTELRLYRTCCGATIAGVSLLLAARSPATILAGSALTGLALAPVFPLSLRCS